MQNASHSYLGKLIIGIGHLVKEAIPLVAGLALLYFLWGVAMTVVKSGDEKSVEEGKNRMKWGIIALFVMICAWGIVQVLDQIVFNSDIGPPSSLCGDGPGQDPCY